MKTTKVFLQTHNALQLLHHFFIPLCSTTSRKDQKKKRKDQPQPCPLPFSYHSFLNSLQWLSYPPLHRNSSPQSHNDPHVTKSNDQLPVLTPHSVSMVFDPIVPFLFLKHFHHFSYGTPHSARFPPTFHATPSQTPLLIYWNDLGPSSEPSSFYSLGYLLQS